MGKLCVAFLSLFLLVALKAVPQENSLLFHHLGVKGGLVETTNAYVYKDSKGFVWISSINGLFKYDGLTTTAFYPEPGNTCSLSDEIIQSSFFEDKHGDIWFCTFRAIHVYRRESNCFESFTIKDPTTQRSLIGYYMHFLDMDDNLWIISEESKLYQFSIKDRQFTKVKNLDHPYRRACFSTSATGDIQFALLHNVNVEPGFGLLNFQNGVPVSEEFILPSNLEASNFNIIEIQLDKNDWCWLLTNKYLYRFHIRSKEFEAFGLPSEFPTSMKMLDTGSLLIGFAHTGLYEFSTDKKIFHSHQVQKWNDPHSLLSNKVNYINIDRDNTIWISSTGTGICYAQPKKKKFKNYSFSIRSGDESFDLDPVKFFDEGNGKIICATTNNGFVEIIKSSEGLSITPVEKINQYISGKRIHTTERDKHGNFWISTVLGMYVFDKNFNRLTLKGEPNGFITSIASAPDSGVLLSTGQTEIFKCAPGDTLSVYAKMNTQTGIYPVFTDNLDRAWIGVDLARFVILKDGNRLDSFPAPGISTNFLYEPKSATYWISSGNGLLQVDGNTFSVKQHNTKSGFPANAINTMEYDENGNIWASFNSGLIKYNPHTGQTNIYSSEDGIPVQPFRNASIKFQDGEMWFGSIGAISSFHPENIQPLDISSIPQITTILVNDALPATSLVCTETGKTNISEIQKLVFDSENSTLTFTLNALEYSAPELNKVRYQLVGVDKSPLEVHSGAQIRYPNLNPGNYTLVVYASNSDGGYSQIPRSLKITITPPFYKTWWFIASVILLVGSIFGYIIYLRISKTFEVQKVRLKLYENLHDDIGSRLTAILLSADEIEQQQQDNLAGIQNIASIAKNVIGNMRRLVWAVDPKNDKMEDIVRAISHDKSIILGSNVDLHVYVDPVLANKQIPGEIRYQICSICNESFTNVAKYAKANHVHLNFWIQDKNMEMELKDDGIGFNSEKFTDKIYSGYGLGNMERRVSRMSGKLKIVSSPGQGTSIHVSIPMK